jgi:two-component system sensor histidine kinase SenX3
MEIAVSDSGLGIPAEEQKEIFDKFYRGSAALKSGVKGTGIGLAMVRHIARAHGGDIRVQSAPGSGSTFTLRLPLVPPSA